MKTTMDTEHYMEILCDYVGKNKFGDKVLLKLIENACNAYDKNNEIEIFKNYFFNMSLIVLCITFLFLESRHIGRIQQNCDNIDIIIDEYDEINKNSWEGFLKQNRQDSHIFVKPWKLKFDKIVKTIPYWANVFKLKRLVHRHELCEPRYEPVCEHCYESDCKQFYSNVFKEIPREASSMNYRRFCNLSKLQKKITETRLDYHRVLTELIEQNRKNEPNLYQNFIRNNEIGSEFVKVQRPGWGWFSF
jgi:hypothetical protein